MEMNRIGKETTIKLYEQKPTIEGQEEKLKNVLSWHTYCAERRVSLI